MFANGTKRSLLDKLQDAWDANEARTFVLNGKVDKLTRVFNFTVNVDQTKYKEYATANQRTTTDLTKLSSVGGSSSLVNNVNNVGDTLSNTTKNAAGQLSSMTSTGWGTASGLVGGATTTATNMAGSTVNTALNNIDSASSKILENVNVDIDTSAIEAVL